MAWCVAVGCKSRSGVIGENNELIYFHYFPKDTELRAKWIHNVQRGNAWAPSRYSRLCSLHFEKSCFQGGVIDNVLLPHAVPTLFPNLPPAYKTRKRRSPPKDEQQTSPKKPKTREIILPSSCKTEFQKYEKLLIMMPYYLRCRCCLRKRMLQDMWCEQVRGGQREVYGEMLAKCFALDLRQPAEHIEQICVVCVTRLRQAVQFKERVLASDRLINKCFYNVRLNFDSDSDTETTKDREDSDQENTENLKQQDFYKDSTDNYEEEDVNQDSTDDIEQGYSIQESTENVCQDFPIEVDTENIDEEDVYQDSTDNYLEQEHSKQDSTDNYLEQEHLKQDSTDNYLEQEHLKQDSTDNYLEQEDFNQDCTESFEQGYSIEETTMNEDQDYTIQENTESGMQDCNDRSIDNESQDVSANEVGLIQENADNVKSNLEITVSNKNKNRGEEFKPTIRQGDDGAEYLDLQFLEDDENAVVVKKVHSKPTKSAVIKKMANKRVYFVTRSHAKGNLKKPVEIVRKSIDTVKKSVEKVNKPVETGKKSAVTVIKSVQTVNRPVETVNKKLEMPIIPMRKRAVKLRSGECLEAMKSRGEASAQGNVPKSTINVELSTDTIKQRSSKSTPQESAAKIRTEENARLKLLQEIKHILKYTDATPYKTRDSKFHCAYCGKGPFAEPNKLRAHTRTIHAKDRLLAVNTFMRPPTRHEILKLDIENLTCVECKSAISTWNDLFGHLTLKHGLELDEAYTKIIPYKLHEFNCVLCKDKFSSYPALDNHMNVHYINYKCNECSSTFITKKRLKAHEVIHTQGTYPCEHCPKVFHQVQTRNRHTGYVHAKPKFKCRFCSEVYFTRFTRHLHMVKHHRLKSEMYACGLCEKTFNWRPYFMKHMQLTHLKREKMYQCALCKKKYKSLQRLRTHENWHKGTSDCECGVCGRKFVTSKFLKKHYEMAHNIMAVNE